MNSGTRWGSRTIFEISTRSRIPSLGPFRALTAMTQGLRLQAARTRLMDTADLAGERCVSMGGETRMPPKSKAVWCVMATLPALFIGCGSARSASGSAQSGMPATCLHPSPVNDSGLSDTQRDQAYRRASAAGMQCYFAWIATLDPATLPYATLPHTGMAASYTPPDGKSLSEAKSDASLVVVGTVLASSLWPR